MLCTSEVSNMHRLLFLERGPGLGARSPDWWGRDGLDSELWSVLVA